MLLLFIKMFNICLQNVVEQEYEEEGNGNVKVKVQVPQMTKMCVEICRPGHVRLM